MKNSTGWPSEADRIDRTAGPDNAAYVDVSCWDKASTLRSSAKQRKRSSAGLQGDLCGRRYYMTAVPSEAESQRSSASGQIRKFCFGHLFIGIIAKRKHCSRAPVPLADLTGIRLFYVGRKLWGVADAVLKLQCRAAREREVLWQVW